MESLSLVPSQDESTERLESVSTFAENFSGLRQATMKCFINFVPWVHESERRMSAFATFSPAMSPAPMDVRLNEHPGGTQTVSN